MTSRLEDFARGLADAQSSHRHVAWNEAAAPRDMAAAMQAQAMSLRQTGAAIGGWKLGFNADGIAIAGPMLQAMITPSPARLALPPRGGLLAEIEIAFRLGRDLPVRPRPWLRDDILAHVGEVLVGIEWLCPRLDARAAAHFPSWLADRLGNYGYVTGANVAVGKLADITNLRTQLWVDGARTHDKHGGHPQNDPLMPLLAYANAQNDDLGGLKAGMVITTGSLTVPLPVNAPCEIRAEIDGIGAVAASVVKP
ncbi:MAG: fumarylacetoacetate hydrolase family protein [Hyphomicrobiales bacterium]|nr:fumarylacetoacetate hydrolase family protein [Hyphomicrobiales bacterium]